MNPRASKLRSLDAVNMWTMAELGENRSKKIYKHLIKKKRRTLEKQEAIREWKREELL